MSRLLCLWAICCLAFSGARGAVYYVDAQAGRDNASGTSATSAWQTLPRVNAMTFAPGDTLLFKRGCSWSGQLAPRGSGQAGKVITIDAYAKGSLPQLNGNGFVESTLVLSEQSYWSVNNLEITNDGATPAVRSGVYIQVVNNVCTGITLRGLFVHHVNGIAAWGNDKWNNAGIRLSLWQDPPTRPLTALHDVLVEGCTVQDVHAIGILMLSNSTTKNRQVVISKNLVNRTGADGIIVQQAANPHIVGNRCYYAGKLANDFQYIAGIWTMACESALVEKNEVAFTQGQVTNGQIFYGDSTAFDIDNGETGIPCIQGNYSHNNVGGFVLVMSGAQFEKAIIRYNVSVNDGHTNCGGGATLDVHHGKVFIEHNVFFNNTRDGLVIADTPDTVYRNNIFSVTGPCNYGTHPQYSHNCFWGSAPTVDDPEKILADPLFVHPGSNAFGMATCRGYQLQQTSPCRGRGMALSAHGDMDFFGNLLADDACDIGAHAVSSQVGAPGRK